jgi:hypothetical protein
MRIGTTPWRRMLHDLSPWRVVYQQSRRWIKAGVLESTVHDLRAALLAKAQPMQPKNMASSSKLPNHRRRIADLLSYRGNRC